jgi:hypothetical protein
VVHEVNLPQYRRALRQAHEEYSERLAAARDKCAEEMRIAGEQLMKAIEVANSEFTEEDDAPMKQAEYAPDRRREPH